MGGKDHVHTAFHFTGNEERRDEADLRDSYCSLHMLHGQNFQPVAIWTNGNEDRKDRDGSKTDAPNGKQRDDVSWYTGIDNAQVALLQLFLCNCHLW